ncbi:hypothetical protein [Marinoscillum furvescens]|uniref:hypothetical protein n=1 Tax=Marinoscillum furvescens TaxID=1026 RepID=UPI000E258782|nr:hypothetical protein [Marinoscillum furvescens]
MTPTPCLGQGIRIPILLRRNLGGFGNLQGLLLCGKDLWKGVAMLYSALLSMAFYRTSYPTSQVGVPTSEVGVGTSEVGVGTSKVQR